MLSRPMAELALPCALPALRRFRVAVSRSLHMCGSAELELVLRAAGLSVITGGANAEPLATDAARTKPSRRIFDDVTATTGLTDRREGADSYRDSFTVWSSQTPGEPPRAFRCRGHHARWRGRARPSHGQDHELQVIPENGELCHASVNERGEKPARHLTGEPAH